MRLELLKYGEALMYLNEYNLNTKPLEVDLLVIEKESGLEIERPIGRIFRKYNLIEYKSPDDELDMDVLCKTIGYGCLFKAGGYEGCKVALEDVTLSIVRHRRPEKLLRELEDRGWKVRTGVTQKGTASEADGIYYIEGMLFPIQIVVTRESRDSILRYLAPNLSKEEVKSLLRDASSGTTAYERTLFDSVLQVAAAANQQTFLEAKEEEQMSCQALREIMAPELEESRREGELQGLQKGIQSGYRQVERNIIARLMREDPSMSEQEARERARELMGVF